jgi:hypothetical protein
MNEAQSGAQKMSKVIRKDETTKQIKPSTGT